MINARTKSDLSASMKLHQLHAELLYVIPPCFATASRHALFRRLGGCDASCLDTANEPSKHTIPWPYHGSPPEQTTRPHCAPFADPARKPFSPAPSAPPLSQGRLSVAVATQDTRLRQCLCKLGKIILKHAMCCQIMAAFMKAVILPAIWHGKKLANGLVFFQQFDQFIPRPNLVSLPHRFLSFGKGDF